MVIAMIRLLAERVLFDFGLAELLNCLLSMYLYIQYVNYNFILLVKVIK